MKLGGWQLVVVIGLVLAAITTLGALGRDTTALIGLGTLLLAGLGVIVGQQVTLKDQTNGNTSRLLAMVEKQSTMLAGMVHPKVIEGGAEPVEEEQPPTLTG